MTGQVRGTRPASRLLSVLAVLAVVLACGVAVRLSEPELDYQAVRGAMREPVVLNGGEVTVDFLRVGRRYQDDYDRTYVTDGMFVVLRVTAAATERLDFRLNRARLTARDRTYEAVDSAVWAAEPGFQASGDVCLEVDPAHVTDLTVELWDAEIVSAYPQRVVVPLGITADNAGAVMAQGRNVAIREQPSTERALP